MMAETDKNPSPYFLMKFCLFFGSLLHKELGFFLFSNFSLIINSSSLSFWLKPRIHLWKDSFRKLFIMSMLRLKIIKAAFKSDPYQKYSSKIFIRNIYILSQIYSWRRSNLFNYSIYGEKWIICLKNYENPNIFVQNFFNIHTWSKESYLATL